jgi:hypothetical protein
MPDSIQLTWSTASGQKSACPIIEPGRCGAFWRGKWFSCDPMSLHTVVWEEKDGWKELTNKVNAGPFDIDRSHQITTLFIRKDTLFALTSWGCILRLEDKTWVSFAKSCEKMGQDLLFPGVLYDPSRDRLVVWGGSDYKSASGKGTRKNSTFIFDFVDANWTKISKDSAKPLDFTWAKENRESVSFLLAGDQKLGVIRIGRAESAILEGLEWRPISHVPFNDSFFRVLAAAPEKTLLLNLFNVENYKFVGVKVAAVMPPDYPVVAQFDSLPEWIIRPSYIAISALTQTVVSFTSIRTAIPNILLFTCRRHSTPYRTDKYFSAVILWVFPQGARRR